MLFRSASCLSLYVFGNGFLISFVISKLKCHVSLHWKLCRVFLRTEDDGCTLYSVYTLLKPLCMVRKKRETVSLCDAMSTGVPFAQGGKAPDTVSLLLSAEQQMHQHNGCMKHVPTDLYWLVCFALSMTMTIDMWLQE